MTNNATITMKFTVKSTLRDILRKYFKTIKLTIFFKYIILNHLSLSHSYNKNSIQTWNALIYLIDELLEYDLSRHQKTFLDRIYWIFH